MPEKSRIRPEDRSRFLCPGDPQISPDGKRVAFTVQRVDPGTDKYQTDLYLVNVDGGNPVPLTSSGANRLPRWSPDGGTLAFVSDRSGKPQVWLMSLAGGEAYCIPTKQRVQSAPVWSPDGRRIAFTSPVFSHGEDWVPYEGAPAWDAKRAKDQAGATDPKAQKISDVKVITKYRHRMDGIGYFGDKRTQVFILDVPEKRPDHPEQTVPGSGTSPGNDVTTASARQLTHGDFDHDAPAFSACGKWIAVSSTHLEDADWLLKSDLWAVNVESGEMRQLLSSTGHSGMPVWSPNGEYIAYIGHDGSHKNSTSQEARVFAADGGVKEEADVISLSRSLDRGVNAIPSSDARYAPANNPCAWSSDGYVYFIIGSEGDTFVYRARPACGEVKPEIAAGERGRVISAMTVANGVIAFQSGSVTVPDEIFCTVAGETRQLTHMNEGLLENLKVCEAQKLTTAGPDGWQIDGWLLLPYGYKPGDKPPMVLQIHGGPHGVYGSSFQFQGQLLASNGTAVLYVNPRGSQSYGQKFAAACVEDWGGKDFGDLMSMVDEVVKRGMVDGERLGVTGWSYGGFMTCWTVAQTNRFKAAVTGACIANRHNFYGTSDIGFNFGEHHFGGTPWDDSEKLLDRSAIKYIKNVTAPVMILHGEADLRCPIEQAEQFFIGLKRLGKTAVLVRYPGEYHAFKVPSHWVDRYGRILSWFGHYLQGETPND